MVVTRDSTPPPAPAVTSGWSANQTTPLTLSGTAEPGSTVTVTASDGTVLSTVTADAAGTWTSGALAGLTPTVADLGLTATDTAGNVSEQAHSGPYAFVPVFDAPAGETFSTDTVPVVIAGWPGSTVVVTLNGANQGAFTLGADGTAHLTAAGADGAPIAVGEYTVTATYSDAGGTSPAAATTGFTVRRP
ncbi:hypothetical protein GCM10025867_20150 [Frondihabitans sucicola]|uniref:Bacterial Ig domain-containing protein n=1 Tax=Frondihabitans sucicola TaxID=1268041 RepID=A0ABN6XXR7_9MICO|nr:Ig-like domain-containing protein [Frondihabitans sucicola]BDZ49774.1 hypothetical protein GCM10025867_20150 [Frondihabitans sucicola]